MVILADAPPSADMIAAGIVADAAGPAGGQYVAAADAMAAFDANDGALPDFTGGTPAAATLGQNARRGDFETFTLLAGGIGFTVAVSLLHRRHRRRIGWSMLPQRQPSGRDPFTGWASARRR